uniref:HAUS augmin-like complex subunit 3 N-terminal domain-containing protein n=1 Tax=Zonotrichia albicollis TaxID=44394 RepID=A0A8D2NJP1_ZONAL
MSCGIRYFMAKLRQIYPHADTLCEKDFEWLFDCPETKQFLEWFCSTVGEENVLSPAEVEAYEARLAAGKPILEGDALEEALQMFCQVLQLPSSIVDEGPSQEALQQELQELKHYHDLQLWRYRKLMAWTNKLKQEQKYLEEEKKVVKQELRVAHMDLKAKIFKTKAVLSQVSKAAKQVSQCPESMEMDQLPTLLCQMDLAPYLEQEQQATDAFESFIQQVLPQCVQSPDVWEASAQGESTLKEALEAETQMDSYCEIPEERRGAGGVAGAGSAVSPGCVFVSPAQQAVQAELQSQAAALPWQLRALRSDIAHMLAQRLPALLRAEARRLHLPILHRHLSLRVARLQDTATRQQEAAAWLLSQQSRLELLELQLKRERKELEHKAAWLEKTKTVMRESQTRLLNEQIYFRGAEPSQKAHPHKWIDPKDLTTGRVWRPELGGESVSGGLSCSTGIRKIPLFLHIHMSLGSVPQEISELMEQLIIVEDDLYQKLADLLSDLGVKRRSLESPMLQAEHSLYVHFYCNGDRLRQEVEELEKQASASSKGPPRELP